MSRLRPLVLAAAAAFALCLGTGAMAASAATKPLSPTKDCQLHNGSLTQKYTAAELQHALNTMQSSTRQYTTCYDAIRDQLQTVNGGKVLTNTNQASGGGGSGTVILIVVIVVVILLGGGLALWAHRRNRAAGGDDAGV
jgi:hypothetical protein